MTDPRQWIADTRLAELYLTAGQVFGACIFGNQCLVIYVFRASVFRASQL